MTVGDPKKMREFAMRPHHVARKVTTSILTGFFRDNWPRHDCPYNDKGWFDYWDGVYLERLEYVGQQMGWEAPVFDEHGRYDSENVKRAATWKTTYHIMRVMLMAEIVNQVIGSSQFDEQVLTLKKVRENPGSTTPEIFILKPLQ